MLIEDFVDEDKPPKRQIQNVDKKNSNYHKKLFIESETKKKTG